MKPFFPLLRLQRWVFAFRVFCRHLTYSDCKKILKYIFKKYILGKNLPISVVFAITYKCQCNCVHCSVGGYSKTINQELSTGEIKDILTSVSRLGIFKVTFFGGEPFLRTDLFELLEYAKAVKLRISIDTNGLALNNTAVRRLKYLNVSNINVSLDSADPLIHDRLRGIEGCFAAALNGIRLCVQAGIPTLVSTYASKRAIASGDLKRLIAFARGLKVNGVKILFPILSGRWKDELSEKLSPEEEKCVRDLTDPSFVYIEDALSMMKNSSEKCSALDRHFFYISPFGDIQLCPAIPISFGNIRKAKLNEILSLMWDHPASKIQCHGCLVNDSFFREQYNLLSEDGSLPIDAQKIK